MCLVACVACLFACGMLLSVWDAGQGCGAVFLEGHGCIFGEGCSFLSGSLSALYKGAAGTEIGVPRHLFGIRRLQRWKAVGIGWSVCTQPCAVNAGLIAAVGG
jgi:hypothetical protein